MQSRPVRADPRVDSRPVHALIPRWLTFNNSLFFPLTILLQDFQASYKRLGRSDPYDLSEEGKRCKCCSPHGCTRTLTALVLYLPALFLFVRDGIHSVADYNSTLMGVVVVVVVTLFDDGITRERYELSS